MECLFENDLAAFHILLHKVTVAMRSERLKAQSLLLATDFWARVEKEEACPAVVIDTIGLLLFQTLELMRTMGERDAITAFHELDPGKVRRQ